MVAVPITGLHFKDPWIMTPHTVVSGNLNLYTTSGVINNCTTGSAFIYGFQATGIYDSTNWTSATYKTIYSHTGSGLVYAMLACTAGGAETTTFEITIDGVLKTITVTNASTERALLVAGDLPNSSATDFTTSSAYAFPNGSIDAGTLTTFQDGSLGSFYINPARWYGLAGVPALRYDLSCLIRMKHSASITNSGATAFSGVLVRKGIAS